MPEYPAVTGGSADRWLVDIDPFMTAIAHTGWDTATLDSLALYCGYKQQSPVAQNNEINFDVVLGPGTWTFELLHTQAVSSGIYTITLNGASLTSLGGSADTIDGYAAATTRNIRAAITGIVIPATAKYRLKLKMATKNGSASNYNGFLQHLQFRRTA